MLGSNNEHVGIINAIDVFKQNSFKAVTVDTDCCIKVIKSNKKVMQKLYF